MVENADSQVERVENVRSGSEERQRKCANDGELHDDGC